jgi:hypothetical protein
VSPLCLKVNDLFQVARTQYEVLAILRSPRGDKWLIKRATAPAFWADARWCGWKKARYGDCCQRHTADCFTG